MKRNEQSMTRGMKHGVWHMYETWHETEYETMFELIGLPRASQASQIDS